MVYFFIFLYSLRRIPRRSLRRSLRNKRKMDGVYNNDIYISVENQEAFNNQMHILDEKLQEIKVIRGELLTYVNDDSTEDSIQEFIMQELFPHRIYVNKYSPEFDDNTYIVELSTENINIYDPGTPFFYWRKDYKNILFEDNDITR